jgi:isocitrate/isopropylmalate dehydrogenase
MMSKVTFRAMVKDVRRRALVSGDLSVDVVLRCIDPQALQMVAAPTDREVIVTAEVEHDTPQARAEG